MKESKYPRRAKARLAKRVAGYNTSQKHGTKHRHHNPGSLKQRTN